MHEAIANYVHPILNYGISLSDRLEAGTALNLDQEQIILKKKLRTNMAAKDSADGDGGLTRPKNQAADKDCRPFDVIRYALTCWLDELFLRYTPWSQTWAQRKLETSLYGTDDGTWKFWKLARASGEQAETDALEVFFLCGLLGFRGELKDAPEKVKSWITTTHDRLNSQKECAWQLPPALDLPTDVPPLRGREKMQRMAFVCGMSFLVLIPFAVFYVTRHLGF